MNKKIKDLIFDKIYFTFFEQGLDKIDAKEGLENFWNEYVN